MKAVITRLMGGLGNQLFQYAAGHALSTRLNVPLLVDRSFLDSRPPGMDWTARAYELHHFNMPVALAEAGLVERILERSTSRRGRLLRHLPGERWHVFRERDKRYDTDFDHLQAPVLLNGSWQCEHYFSNVATELRERLFVPRHAPSEQNEELAARIRTGTSASLHIRLGDYVTNANAAGFHGVCSWAYYREAAAWLVSEHGVDHFHIFTDTPSSIRRSLDLPFAHTIVEHNTGSEAHWDLWLMKQARHHIIANSSFSWWGAWLNPAPDKVVIAPRIWFAGDPRPHDIIPATWTVR